MKTPSSFALMDDSLTHAAMDGANLLCVFVGRDVRFVGNQRKLWCLLSSC